MQKLLNDGITPTANKINEIATKNYNMNNIVQENFGSGKKESLETVINQNQNSIQHSMQHSMQNSTQNMIVQTPISVGVPSFYQNNYVIPATHIQKILKKLKTNLFSNFFFRNIHFELYFGFNFFLNFLLHLTSKAHFTKQWKCSLNV